MSVEGIEVGVPEDNHPLVDQYNLSTIKLLAVTVVENVKGLTPARVVSIQLALSTFTSREDVGLAPVERSHGLLLYKPIFIS